MTVGLVLIANSAAAQTAPSAPQLFVEELRQQERERALREQQDRGVDTRLPREAPVAAARLSEAETPCFRIDRLVARRRARR